MSLDESVVSIDDTGIIDVMGTGSATVMVTVDETDTYTSAVASVMVNVLGMSYDEICAAKAEAAVAWAINIANDDDFHYGVYDKNGGFANHYGCYFCGTNGEGSVKAKKGWPLWQIEKSYCCNPFVTAAWCHGASQVEYGNDVRQYVDCRKHPVNLRGAKSCGVQTSGAFRKIDKSEGLQVGDVVITANHAYMYAGNGQRVESSGGDDGVYGSKKWNHSIRVCSMGNEWATDKADVYRYIGG